ncbi:DUF2793 domain-containing protein [Octadecabacter sp. CECT 8868]|uniref:DUF2793 domain-containing protein n=1 Tax=Octadecabacter algicola TaxID=2909342 RepID=UPI001F37BAE8|nr:DUF2793 domain-containing protein [Octadecabacter algicola]MCF2903368.1 DUF2793 domain-containing protein [Octadecabacter algicola]
MSDVSANLELPYLAPAQAQKHVTHNEALQIIDAVVQLSVESRILSEPSGTVDAGTCFVVPELATGVWMGQDNKIALWNGTGWIFLTAKEGWRAWVIAEGLEVVMTSGAWMTAEGQGASETFGINTTADVVNRLSVAADATLLSHDGGGHQLKVNKASSGDTGSLLYQSNWSGRAEMGLAGNDEFSIKVSDDGSIWTEALRFDGADGLASGAAVTQGPTDTLGGRLIRNGDGYVKSTVVGTVSESGGVPTGAIIESGSNANGDYVRFADGSQICTATLTLGYSGAVRLSGTWTYPVPFASEANVTGIVDLADLNVNATPGPDEVGSVMLGSNNATSAVFWLYRLSGMTNFTSADTCEVKVHSRGRWF